MAHGDSADAILAERGACGRALPHALCSTGIEPATGRDDTRMLHELTINDFAIIERATLRLTSGLNALTGETGAGKSILLDALGAVLGARVSSDLVRTGARLARVEGIFDLDGPRAPAARSILESIGIPFEDSEDLILSREILATGRSSARINRQTVTASQLADVGAVLVDIHGQSDHLAILRKSEQRAMLDRYAGHDALLADVAAAWRRWRDVNRQLAALSTNQREREQRVDLLRYQAEEIASAELIEGEDTTLAAERGMLQNADRIRLDVQSSLATLVADDADSPAVVDSLRRAEAALADLATLDGTASPLSERGSELVLLAEDLARDLRSYLDAIDLDPARLDEVDERLAQIQALRRKYGETIADIMAFGSEATRELEELTGDQFDLDSLTNRAETAAVELRGAVSRLSSSRRTAAARLAAAIEQAIAELRMGRAAVRISVATRDARDGLAIGDGTSIHVDEFGADEVEYLIASNASEAFKPLARIASGGETARLMLALKSILSSLDDTPTLVFDEIDVGVGGRSAQVVGEKLARLALEHQVIVVTHLAQIASMADTHLRITKVERDARTISIVEELFDRDRTQELAMMIDGIPLTESAVASAAAMLARSRDAKQAVAGNGQRG